MENLTEANFNSNRNSMKYQQCKTLFILHVPVIKFDRINFTLFYSENINLPSEKFLGNVRQIKWNHAVLIYNDDSVEIASFLTDKFFSIIE